MWSFILALVLSSNSEDGRWERKPVMHKHTLSSNVSGTCSNKRTQMLHARARKKKQERKDVKLTYGLFVSLTLSITRAHAQKEI